MSHFVSCLNAKQSLTDNVTQSEVYDTLIGTSDTEINDDYIHRAVLPVINSVTV